jgi:hypothetical protein
LHALLAGLFDQRDVGGDHRLADGFGVGIGGGFQGHLDQAGAEFGHGGFL